MSGTISGTITNTYTLSVNPTTVTKTGAVKVTRANETAIYGPASAAWTLNNAGTVSASSGYGVDLQAGGTITNAAGASITGGVLLVPFGYPGNYEYVAFGAGIGVSGGTGTVINSGTVQDVTGRIGYYEPGIDLNSGGSVTNTKGGVIAGANFGIFGATDVANSGTISGAYGSGIVLGPGSVANEAGGVIAGYTSSNGLGHPAPRYGDGIHMGAGTVTNAGTINGVALGAGYVDNQAGGVITNGVEITSAGGTVVNAGSITNKVTATGTRGIYYAGTGVYLQGGGSITNNAGGVISGGAPAANGIQAGGTGIAISGGAGTVVNAGTISGIDDAVKLAAGFANRVVVDPGAVFNGIVDGGNAIGGPVASTLELAAGGHGTLFNLNIQFVDFSNVLVDSGANWQIAASTTIPAGQTLNDAGTLFYGGSLGVAGDIVLDGGTFAADGLTIAAGGVVSGTGTISSASSAPLTVAFGATLDAVGGTLAVGSKAYEGGSGTATIAGAMDGKAIDFTAGRTTLEKGVHGTVGAIELSSGAELSLGPGLTNLTYPGEFDDTTVGGDTQFLPHANNVTLSGSASFIGSPGTAEIVGTGSLTLAGSSHLGGVAIENGESLLDSGSLVQSGTVTLDNSSSLRVTATGTWDITADTGIGLGSGATGGITNIGTFEKTAGTGTSVIGADFVNNGTIIASSGTLDFAGGFTNHGKIIQNGGTVIVGPAANPALFNQYAAGTEPDGVASTVAAAGPETQPPPTLAPPHAA